MSTNLEWKLPLVIQQDKNFLRKFESKEKTISLKNDSKRNFKVKIRGKI